MVWRQCGRGLADKIWCFYVRSMDKASKLGRKSYARKQIICGYGVDMTIEFRDEVATQYCKCTTKAGVYVAVLRLEGHPILHSMPVTGVSNTYTFD